VSIDTKISTNSTESFCAVQNSISIRRSTVALGSWTFISPTRQLSNCCAFVSSARSFDVCVFIEKKNKKQQLILRYKKRKERKTQKEVTSEILTFLPNKLVVDLTLSLSSYSPRLELISGLSGISTCPGRAILDSKSPTQWFLVVIPRCWIF
jgi:hypothetical protein